jgi:hypothetical protein
MMLDKLPTYDVCTLEADRSWSVWRGVRFIVLPITLDGTVDDLVTTIQGLLDAAPLKGASTEAVFTAETTWVDASKVSLRLWLHVESFPQDHGRIPQPLAERLRNEILATYP